MEYKEKIRLAQDENTSPEILEELSRDEDWDIRCNIVKNPSTPERVLDNISRFVGLTVAEDLSTPENILIRLSKSKDWDIRGYVAKNPSAPERALIRLSRDRMWSIRDKVIRNKNLRGILKEMVRVRLEGEERVDWLEFVYNRIGPSTNFLFLKGWEGRYFHGLL